MFVIEVILFSRHIPQGSLSYRSRNLLSVGTIVSVPLRNKIVTGIVTSCIPVIEAKESIKKANFILKSGNIHSTGKIPDCYRLAAEKTAIYNASTVGSVFKILFPESILSHKFQEIKTSKENKHTVSYIEKPREERIEKYKSYIQNNNLLIVAPTTVECVQITKAIDNSVLITGELSVKKREKAFEEAEKAKVIVTTPYFAFTPIKKFSRIIIERESANSWINITQPNIDIRTAIKNLAEELSVPLTIGDYPIRTDTRPENIKNNLNKTIKTPMKIIDMREKKVDTKKSTNVFKAVPDVISSKLSHTIKNGGRAVVIVVRKGYSPSVICRDCGNSVRDEQGRALSLATINKTRVLRSADGKILRDVDVICDTCGSWNLLPLGIGIERVIEELNKTIPEANIIRFDSDTIKTPASARRISSKFKEQGSIIVGTESVLPWLNDHTPYDVGVIASADSLLALPFWRSRERLMHMVITLADKTNNVYIATRRPDDTVFTSLEKKDINIFFDEETELRKTLSYPPYGHLLVIKITGTSQEQLSEGEDFIRKIISDYKILKMPDRQVVQKHTRTLVIKIPLNSWPNSLISKQIMLLPKWITFSIDSESLW